MGGGTTEIIGGRDRICSPVRSILNPEKGVSGQIESCGKGSAEKLVPDIIRIGGGEDLAIGGFQVIAATCQAENIRELILGIEGESEPFSEF
jgi:hypothetical protein